MFVLRGSTRDPVYVFSETGELRRMIKLHAPNVEFSSPRIYGNQLVVHQVRPAPKSGVVTERAPDLFPVFNLESSALVQQFEWQQEGSLHVTTRAG